MRGSQDGINRAFSRQGYWPGYLSTGANSGSYDLLGRFIQGIVIVSFKPDSYFLSIHVFFCKMDSLVFKVKKTSIAINLFVC